MRFTRIVGGFNAFAGAMWVGVAAGVAVISWAVLAPVVPPEHPGRNVPEASRARPEKKPDSAALPQPLHPLSQTLASIEASVVRVEAVGKDASTHLGSGFVIDDRGLVATSYHVLSAATEASARFRNGSTFDVAGYVAIHAESDLAIVALRSPPSGMAPLQLSTDRDPPPLSHVLAIGHPHGIDFSPYDGRISRVLNTSDLPPRSQRFLQTGPLADGDQRWIQHTAGLAEGNSGGPLLNELGQVIGVNTWVDKEARFGYAIHVRHLRELQARIAETPIPLAALARPDPRRSPAREPFGAQELEALHGRARAIRFRPVSAEDYAILQQLAWAVTVANLPLAFPDLHVDPQSHGVVRAADRIVAELTSEKWDDLGQLTIINEHALQVLESPGAGLFFFAAVERIVDGDDGTRGALLRLAGDDQMLFAPLDDQLGLPPIGVQCLVLAVNYHGRVVRYGENPLRLIAAPIIATRTIVPLGQEQ